ncbi:MAG TPA: glycerol-3-phosphate dehydrogenase/oxidase [Acidimicrobiales bacterium]
MSATPFRRDAALARLRDEDFDVLVVGGGVTGCGIALDAAARGLRTALVERDDFASGTSSKSSKLIHGGLRYLQQKEYRLVYENLSERQRLLDNAPHLVSPLPFLIPLFGKNGIAGQGLAKAYSTALWLYDLTGGIRIGKRHRRIGKEEVLAHMPGLRADRLVAGFLYWDAQADDARLTLTLARTAADHGATVANYAGVTALTKDDGRLVGATVHPRDGDPFPVVAKVIVNAAGVWADDVRALAEGHHPHSLRPAKGIHLTLPRAKLPVDVAAVIPVPGDRRSIFVVPWGDEVYLGTTDTDYEGPLEDPPVTPEDVSYVLNGINAWVAGTLVPEDVVGAWAGLRPLVRAATTERTADLSRRHVVSVDDEGLVSITGGKLTTYRKMAADTVDEVARRLSLSALRRSPTRKLRLHGARGSAGLRGPEAAARLGVPEPVLAHLVSRFGAEARTVAAMVVNRPALGAPLVPGLPYLRAEAVFSARYEMVHTLADVLSRRTRALLLSRDAAAGAAADTAEVIAADLGWSPAETALQVAAFRTLAERQRVAAGLPASVAVAP